MAARDRHANAPPLSRDPTPDLYHLYTARPGPNDLPLLFSIEGN